MAKPSAIHAFVAVERDRSSRAMRTFRLALLGARRASHLVLPALLSKAASAFSHFSSLSSATSRHFAAPEM